MDPQLVDKIVHEVKSQGVFDHFRKDSMSDVDTKPAYQNLRQRVESAVKKFLQEQRWTPETNKNQLRERLRRHIAESGFLDVGVERIVDQVVNPKIGSVFQPRIEEIAYNYLGIPLPPIKYEPPPPPMIHPLHPLPPLPLNGPALKVETTSSMLPTDLEQVSPDSDKATVKSEYKEETESQDMDIDEKPDEDDESPPFEPLVKCASPVFKQEHDENETHNTDVEVNAVQSLPMPHEAIQPPGVDLDTETQDTSVSANTIEPDSEKETSRSLDAVGLLSQESQLSQVSSDSRISTASHDFTENENGVAKSQSPKDAAVNISEEAQMPKFNDNSSEVVNGSGQTAFELHFDIKKDEIKFEGTERKSNLLPPDDVAPLTHDGATSETKGDSKDPNNTFQFANLNVNAVDANATGADSSFGSSLEDTCSAQLYIAEKTLPEPITQSEQKSSAPVTPNESSAVSLPLSAPPPSLQRHSSSSSSRHKKHSKDKRRRSHEKDRPKSKDSRDRHRSSSKHSTSNSSKHSSSVHKSTSSESTNKSEKSSVKHLTSSSSSSSRSEGSKREGDKDKRHSSSNSSKEPSATLKKDDRKSSIPNDDHNETKNKMNWRKSTDSNDEDKCPGSGTNASSLPLKSPQSTTASNAPTNSNKTSSKSRSSNSEAKLQNDSLKKEPTVSEWMQSRRSKVVLLCDILQNPATDFIELEAHTLHSNHVQVQVVSTVLTDVTTDSKPDHELLFFEELKGNEFTERLKLLDVAMNDCRNVVNHLHQSDAVNLYDEVVKVKEEQLSPGKKRPIKCQTQATLHVDCIQYTTKAGEQIDFEAEIDKTPRKRLRHAETKTSPTPSDNSVNSKENEIFDKNSSVDAKSRRTTNANKYSQQQRYTSEDLYKPRPILSQRSRRRGVDTII